MRASLLKELQHEIRHALLYEGVKVLILDTAANRDGDEFVNIVSCRRDEDKLAEDYYSKQGLPTIKLSEEHRSVGAFVAVGMNYADKDSQSHPYHDQPVIVLANTMPAWAKLH